METMQLSFCHLCGESRDEASLTYILSERGKVEKLEFLIDQYIIPILVCVLPLQLSLKDGPYFYLIYAIFTTCPCSVYPRMINCAFATHAKQDYKHGMHLLNPVGKHERG